MKTRKGFVSNSSSTSFIIVVDNAGPCPHCGRSDPDFIDMVERVECYDSDTDVDATGKENIIDYIKSNWFWGDLDDDNARFADLFAELNNLSDDKKVALISVSYHDEFLRTLLKESKSIKIIYKEND